MILRVEEIPKSEMHLVPITDLREQIRQDRLDVAEHVERELPDGAPTNDARRRPTPAR